MAHFKRKHPRSSTMKKCSICGSQRRQVGNSMSKVKDRRQMLDRRNWHRLFEVPNC